MAKKTVTDLQPAGKRVLTRVDFNVPIDEGAGAITDDRRIRQALPTIRAILDGGGTAILMSHLGRPKGKPDPRQSLAPCAVRLSELLGRPVKLAPDCTGPAAKASVDALKPGDCLLLENLRFHREEEDYHKTDGVGDAFAAELAGFADLYVNDAFGTAHRAHASVVGVPARLPAGARALGLLFEKELRYLGGLVAAPQHPFTAVLGGAKVSDKIKVIENLSRNVDVILVGGAMAYTFMSARGEGVGASRVEREELETARGLMRLCEERQCTLLLPIDHLTGERFAADAAPQVGSAIAAGRMGLDIGPQTALLYREIIIESKTVLWNGPMGVSEWEAFSAGTRTVAEAMARNAAGGGTAVVGGGDSAAAVEKLGLADRMSWVSTGGGATLEFLEGRPFPALEHIDDE
jgi:3-phosphoglycerate kinase